MDTFRYHADYSIPPLKLTPSPENYFFPSAYCISVTFLFNLKSLQPNTYDVIVKVAHEAYDCDRLSQSTVVEPFLFFFLKKKLILNT